MLLSEFIKDFGVKKYFRTPKNIKYSLLANFIQLVLEGDWIGTLTIPKDFSQNATIADYFRVLDPVTYPDRDALRFGDVYIILSPDRYRYGVFLNSNAVLEQPNHLNPQHEVLKDNIQQHIDWVKSRGYEVVLLRPLNEKNIFPSDDLRYIKQDKPFAHVGFDLNTKEYVVTAPGNHVTYTDPIWGQDPTNKQIELLAKQEIYRPLWLHVLDPAHVSTAAYEGVYDGVHYTTWRIPQDDITDLNSTLALLRRETADYTTDDIKWTDVLPKLSIFYNVMEYGAAGDGVTDDSAAIQATIDAALADNGGTIFFPSGNKYLLNTGLVIDPMLSDSGLNIYAHGTIIDYQGNGDALTIETNIEDVDVQRIERNVRTQGLYIKGTAAAKSAIRLKACFCSFRDTTIEGFTSTTQGDAGIILDALFHNWVEENVFESLEINNTGNGILFLSRDEVAGVVASCMNNYISNCHIWISQDGGKGIYTYGMGASGIGSFGRNVIQGPIIHTKIADDVVAFDLEHGYCEGTVIISPSVDVFGSSANLVFFHYEFSQVLTIIGAVVFDRAQIADANFFVGAGNYFVIGGNYPSAFRVDQNANIHVTNMYLKDHIYGRNDTIFIEQNPQAGAVNHLAIRDGAPGDDVWLYPSGDDTDIDLILSGKNDGVPKLSLGGDVVGTTGSQTLENKQYLNPKIIGDILDANGEVLIFQNPQAGAVNYLAIKNAATGDYVLLYPDGADADIDLRLSGKGTGLAKLITGGAIVGTVEAQTLENKILTAPEVNNGVLTDPQINVIHDTNDEEILRLLPSGTPVNVIALGNSDTGQSTYITPQGTDADINIDIYGKGNGRLRTYGYMELLGAGGGIVLRSPDNTQYVVTVSNAGALVVTPL